HPLRAIARARPPRPRARVTGRTDHAFGRHRACARSRARRLCGGAKVTAPFPTRRQEEWRYADLDALRPVWEQFAEPVTLTVGPGERFEEVWLPTSDDVQVRRVQIALEQGAKARLFLLNTAPVYG